MGSSRAVVRGIAIAVAGIAVGIASAAVAFASWRVAWWAGDLIAGWALIGSGLIALSRTSTSRLGALLVIAGFAWFVGDYAVLAGAPGWIAGALTWVHRGVLFHAIMTVPSGRLVSRFQRSAVAIGYALSLVPWIWTNATPAVAVSLAAVGAAAIEYSRSWGARRLSKRRALEASAILAGSTAAGFLIRAIVATPLASTTALIAYDIAVALAGVLLVLASGAMGRGEEVADLVIELDDAGGSGLEGALRRELGDARLTLSYADSADSRWGTGATQGAQGAEATDGASSDGGRETLIIDLDGGRFAVLSVAGGALVETPLRQSVVVAIRLDAANRYLRMDVANQVEAVSLSRARLIRAADDAGRELEERLRSGADERLDALERLLHGCETDERASTFDERLTAVQALLLDARDDIARFAAGLHPRALDELGLAGALGVAAHESGITVDLEIDEDDRVTPDIQLAAYFFCLEGLVNIAKHASARRAWVRVAAVEGELSLEVADDGDGGATPGSGIQGIADRIAALGGTLTLESGRGDGTRLIGRVPLDGSAAVMARVEL